MITFERIKELAKKQGKSLNKVEEDLGYGKNVLYRLKNSNPSTERLQEIADYFDVSVDYLLGREEKETPKHVDLSEDNTVFSFDGKEISKETMRKAIAIAKALEENE
ncbi:helix-turn-helix transcriptional regulator [Enterococcus faecium]|nr:helix-turn-helix transcriptional regulator [Enterococcus faecium]